MKEKIAVLKAIDKGLPIQYSETDGETDEWEDLKTTELDFDLYTYRVKPNSKPKTNPDARFKIGDVLVRKTAENMLNPTRFLVKKVFDDEYVLESSTITDREVIEDMFVSEKDVLWYFEFYDYASKEYSLSSTRNTIEKADKDFAPYHDTFKWQPMYLLGFRLKEN